MYTMFHEMLHIAIGQGDAAIENMMSIDPAVVRVQGSGSITFKLEQVCGHN